MDVNPPLPLSDFPQEDNDEDVRDSEHENQRKITHRASPSAPTEIDTEMDSPPHLSGLPSNPSTVSNSVTQNRIDSDKGSIFGVKYVHGQFSYASILYNTDDWNKNNGHFTEGVTLGTSTLIKSKSSISSIVGTSFNFTFFPVIFTDRQTMEYTVRAGVCFSVNCVGEHAKIKPTLEWQSEWMDLSRHGMGNVNVDVSRIQDSEASMSAVVTAVTNARGRLMSNSYADSPTPQSQQVYIWFDIIDVGLAQQDISNPLYQISGPSLGLATFAACNGLAPCFYSGFTRNVSPYLKRVHRQVGSDKVSTVSNVPVINRDDTVETVEGLPLKIEFALSHGFPIAIPHLSTLNLELTKVLADVPASSYQSGYIGNFGVNISAERFQRRPYMLSMGQFFWSYEHQLCGMNFDSNKFAPIILCSTLTETCMSCLHHDFKWIGTNLSQSVHNYMQISIDALRMNMQGDAKTQMDAHNKLNALRVMRNNILGSDATNADKLKSLEEWKRSYIQDKLAILERTSQSKDLQRQTEMLQKKKSAEDKIKRGSGVIRAAIRTVTNARNRPLKSGKERKIKTRRATQSHVVKHQTFTRDVGSKKKAKRAAVKNRSGMVVRVID
ncbi:MAG: hypothetical protein ACTSWQ_06460 [Candidatus Thorarchaeota archaeon]